MITYSSPLRSWQAAAAGLLLVLGLVFASGTTPQHETYASGSEVIIHDEDGVLYLGTEVVGEDGEEVVVTRNRRGFTFYDTNIWIPTGYALTISSYISALLTLVMLIAALLVFMYLIWGAFDWITSGGDKGKIDKARQKIIASIVGLLIIASSWAVLLLVLNFLGFESFGALFDNLKTVDGEGPAIVEIDETRRTTELGELTEASDEAELDTSPTPSPEPTRNPFGVLNFE